MDTSTQLGLAALVAFVIQWAKNSSWFPWLTTETDKVNRAVAVLLSGLASFGIHATWNGTNHSLLIEGLGLSTILPALWHWFVQFLYTHGIYKSAQVLPLLRKLAAVLQAIQNAQPAGKGGMNPTQGVSQ